MSSIEKHLGDQDSKHAGEHVEYATASPPATDLESVHGINEKALVRKV